MNKQPKDGLHFDGVIPTVPLPSSDLIVYRFDQTDKKIDALDKKFGEMTHVYATKEEFNIITKRLDNYTWYWRAVFTGFLLTVSGIVIALIKRS